MLRHDPPSRLPLLVVLSQIEEQAKLAWTSSFVTVLVLNAAILGVEIFVVTIAQMAFPSIHEPRAQSLPEGKKQQPLGDGLLSWPISIYKANHNEIRQQNGMDD
ncbi:hypothetical protein FRC07_006780 [Ceratobasidium sp. 392]|nr:hypothetical protein FRC07_006780 [Ceratobasidium sp. 392]